MAHEGLGSSDVWILISSCGREALLWIRLENDIFIQNSGRISNKTGKKLGNT